MSEAHKRRRIDRIVAPDYLHGMEDADVESLRAKRDECREEEALLSYARRVLQAQLDVARTEAARRRGELDGDDTSLVAQLPGILADAPTSAPRAPRPVGFGIPERSGKRAGDLDAPGLALSQLPDLSDAELADYIGRLSEQEERVSHQRAVVLDHLDRLQAELVRRYREGGLTVDDLVAPTAGDDATGGE